MFLFKTTLPPGQTAPVDMMIESSPNQQVMSAPYNVQSQEYSMINNQTLNIPLRSSSDMMQLQQPSAIIDTQAPSPSSSAAAARSGGMESRFFGLGGNVLISR
jgi:hypothetical protein